MSERPTLFLFPISHYCEKARWALDHHGIEYRVERLAPGPHAIRMKRLGAEGSSVPLLKGPGVHVQGSALVVDWCDAQGSAARCLTPDAHAEAARALEARADRELGVQIRRHAYSEAVPVAPGPLRRRMRGGLSVGQALAFSVMWPAVRGMMIRGMDLGRAQREDARGRIERELDWLDELLSDGRRYLVGDGFTRADLAVASLLSPIADPPERPDRGERLPTPAVNAAVDGWRERPAIRWARSIYAAHRVRDGA